MGAATTNVKWYRSPLFPLVIASGNSAATDDRGQDMKVMNIEITDLHEEQVLALAELIKSWHNSCFIEVPTVKVVHTNDIAGSKIKSISYKL
tara:strand:+ start:127 stop:402 length:276 start_codon:yes stop_codon:yes gene_type:complete